MMMAQAGGGSIDYTLLPLTFKCITGGNLSIKNENTSWDRNFEYSLNNGAWTAFSLPKSSGVLLIATLSPGDTISFRRDNDNFYQAQFVSDSSLTFDIYGNLLSLQYGSAFNGQTALRNTSKQAFGYTFKGTNVVDASNLKVTAPTLSSSCYQYMFQNCALMESAPELPATTLASYCYRGMFWGCNSLTAIPSVLPAATLQQNCYQDMFRYCSSLTSAPEISATTLALNCCYAMFYGCSALTAAPALHATTMVDTCYREMFYGCTALVNAPSLPATTLASDCYRSMFYGCSNLTVTPELPATTLANNCYYEMFRNCTALTAAPELKAATLVSSCYAYMFTACSQLSYVKCLATDISASGCTGNWLASVSATGTFVKAASMSGWARNGNGIPADWAIIDATD